MNAGEADHVYAVDPGKLSGWCRFSGGVLHESGELQMFDLLEQFEQDLSDHLEKNESVVVLCESFTITQETLKKTREPWSLEIIGALRYLAWRYRAGFLLQRPADAKRLITDERIKWLEWWRPTRGGHANDAVRHLAYGLVKAKRLRLPASEV